MSRTLTFLHTSPLHIETFDRLLEEYESIPVKHLVHESLLEEAAAAGFVTKTIQQSLLEILKEASEDAKVILCTCSTLGSVAEKMNNQLDPEIIRIDRPMAERALELGKRIAVVAAAETTLQPTRELLEDAAEKMKLKPDLSISVAQYAWQSFLSGNINQYHKIIAGHVDSLSHEADVIVLAQASMAGANAYLETSKPVLSSPAIGLEASMKAFKS